MFACTAMVLGCYYIAAGLDNDESFARRTVWGRPLVFTLMVLARVPRGMLLFGFSDLSGAVWTWYALRISASTQRKHHDL